MIYNSRDKAVTKIAKGNISGHTLVTVKNPLDYSTKCIVEDENGNQEEYLYSEFVNYGVLEKDNNSVFEIVEDLYDSESILVGNKILSKNVRACKEEYKFWEDCRYTKPSKNTILIPFKDLTDEEVTNIILEEIIYGVQPDLQSCSLVGTTAKGIDKNPNYRNGHYLLPNSKNYTVTWCYGKILIREGIDGGWYKGSKEVGRTVYEGEMDWQRYKIALIKAHCQNRLRYVGLFEEFPEIEQIMFEKYKDDESFKLNSEYDN